MKSDKSMEEVWKWKDDIYDENKEKSLEEMVRTIKESASKLLTDHELKLRSLSRRH